MLKKTLGFTQFETPKLVVSTWKDLHTSQIKFANNAVETTCLASLFVSPHKFEPIRLTLQHETPCMSSLRTLWLIRISLVVITKVLLLLTTRLTQSPCQSKQAIRIYGFHLAFVLFGNQFPYYQTVLLVMIF